MARRRRKRRGISTGWLVAGAVVLVSSAAVLWYVKKHPGPAATALFIAWLTPGLPPPGPLGG